MTSGAVAAAADLLPTIQSILEGAGVVAFAVSGALVAGRRRMDLVGVMVLGAIVAVGGGSLRDMMMALVRDESWTAKDLKELRGEIDRVRRRRQS